VEYGGNQPHREENNVPISDEIAHQFFEVRCTAMSGNLITGPGSSKVCARVAKRAIATGRVDATLARSARHFPPYPPSCLPSSSSSQLSLR
jgi:hypothetical protein